MDVFEESYSSNRVVGGVYKVYAKDTEKDISEDVALRMVANIYLSEGLPMYFEYDGVKHILTITYLMRVGEEKWTDCSVHL